VSRNHHDLATSKAKPPRFSPHASNKLTAPRLILAAISIGLLLLFPLPSAPQRGGIFQKTSQQSRQTLDWRDRRPIASLFLPGDGAKQSFSAEGLAELRSRLMSYADRSVALLKEMNAQGIIVWNLEGDDFPHPDAAFVGDPTLLFRIDPQMDLVADEFFRRFSSQGFSVGILLRPQQIVFRPDGSFYQQEAFLDAMAIFKTLDRKIRYAKNRWGCSLFYIDSNFGPLNLGLYDATIFKWLQKKYPDALLIPEHENEQYFAYTAPYYDLKGREKWPGTRSLSIEHTSVYPSAFSVINTADADLTTHRAELVQAVKRGDILLFRGWWRSPEFAAVSSIYREGISDAGPVVYPDFFTMRPSSNDLLDVLRNDFELGTPRPLQILSISSPRCGTARIENGKVHYFAPSNVVGNVEFEYTVSDGSKSATASVVVSVVD
jgi:hypothetical protein